MALGKLGPYTRAQKEVASCKSDLKIYAGYGLGTLVKSLVAKATAGTQSAIKVGPKGFEMSGMLSNFSIDIAKGDFIMASLSFAGMGTATMDTSSLTSAAADGTPAAFTPITTDCVTVSGSPSCPTSLKFSLDIPTEIISCIGAGVLGTQLQIAETNTMIGKVPYKGAITLEGLTLNTSAAGTLHSAFSIGTATGDDVIGGTRNADVISVNITDAVTVSRSFNQAAGDLGANYSYNMDGSTVEIS